VSSLDDALAAIWERSRPVVAERLARVEAAAASNGPDDAARHEGLRAAHQLAGSLGTFGLHEGSDVARAIEQELGGAADAAKLAELSGRLRELLAPRLA
jgi:HPt (histidine-containing phosphotransfer) domain-containing protein